MREIWVEAKGFPLYIVSSLGNVRHTKTDLSPKFYVVNNRIRITLKTDSGWQNVWLHRLVASSFYDEDISSCHIKHVDGDKMNNALRNLEVIEK